MDACRTCRGQFEIPEFGLLLYTPSTDHIQHYNMSYSEGDDESGDSGTDGDAKSDETGALRGLLCRTAHEVVFRAIGY